LTPKRRYRITENDEYAAFVRRVIRAYSRRVAAGDIEAITTMAGLADHLEDATRQAITGLRDFGYSWAEVQALPLPRRAALEVCGDDPDDGVPDLRLARKASRSGPGASSPGSGSYGMRR
jgi:hypothetical protein